MSHEIDFSAPQIRVSVEEAALQEGVALTLDGDRAHYLANVMRLKAGDKITLFNGRDGAFAASIGAAARKRVDVVLGAQVQAPDVLPDLWLLFAPIKKARTDFLVEKATELGVGRLVPILTQYTQTRRFNGERARAQVIEAVEQCHGVSLPDVAELAPLNEVLADWPTNRPLYFCDEKRDAVPLAQAVQAGPAAILIGPEGGFSGDEREKLKGLPFTRPVTLGARILRAETAAVTALAQFHACAERT